MFALCAAGMAVGGDAAAAADCFARAWAACTDDCEFAVAAHYVARTQADVERLRWDACAVEHAEASQAAGDTRADALLASLYLNLGASLLAAGRRADARDVVTRAEAALGAVSDDGYRTFVATGIARLRARVDATPAHVRVLDDG